MAGSVLVFDEVLASLARSGCRFVIIGSVARALAGEDVVAHDLDVMIDPSADERRRLVRVLAELGATVETRNGQRRIEQCTVLPWQWGFRATTPVGQVDVITELIDGTTIHDHDEHAISVELGNGCSVRVRPTRHEQAA
jgi:hypothetical protein